MPRNPFEVLGLTPELVGELSEKQLRGVLKTMYRALQKTFHPDVASLGESGPSDPEGGPDPPAGGKKPPANGERAAELNLAYESLDRDPATFRRHRKSYLAKRPGSAFRNSVLLKNQLEALAEKENKLAANFFSYLKSLSAPGQNGGEKPSPPLPAKGVKLGLLDVAINNNVRQSFWLTGSNYKQMEFDSDGLLKVKAVGRGRFSRSNFIHPLGCVPVQAIDLEPLLERTNSQSFREMASYPGVIRPKLKVLNLISLENFKKHVLPLLAPVLLERAYLFSINDAEFKKTGLISLEGVIVKIDPI
ncbi:MAG: J domain-containing protein [Deltaproteobacteria bacterium]|jgi:hypothetical protein|nr:J domain-containing protein [Deltaproteobacteria bacterium]